MNIETKVVKRYSYSSFEGTKEEYLNFGWVHTEDTEVRSGRSHTPAYVLARDKDAPNYGALVALESEYFHLKYKKKTYRSMEWENVLLAFVFLIIPGIIYVTIKLNQKKKIKEHNAEIQRQMNAVAAKAKALL